MIRRTGNRLLWLLLCASIPSVALAAPKVDCAKHFHPDATAEDAYKMKATDIQECVHKGWDPPAAWLPNMSAGATGSTAGGSGGFSVGTIQSPERPPAVAIGAGLNLNNLCFSYGGYSLCGNIRIDAGQLLKKSNDNSVNLGSNVATIDDAGDVTLPSNVCPITSGDRLRVTNQTTKQSYYGVFGPNTWFTSTNRINLNCGGTVPLNNFRLSLVQNPTGLVRVEQWVPYIWIYKATGNKYQQIGDARSNGALTETAVRLPKFLCEEYRDDGRKKRRPARPPLPSYTPTGEMIAYNRNTQTLALQLMMQPNTTDSDLFSAENPDAMYLRIPMVNGVPYVPRDGLDANGKNFNWRQCDLQEDYVKPYKDLKNRSNLTADIIIESTMRSGCSSSEKICASLKPITAPTTPANCETYSLFPEIPASVSKNNICEGKVQHFGLDHPNLYFPPLTAASALPFVDSKGKQWPKFPDPKKKDDPTVDFYMLSTNSGSAQYPARFIGTSDSTIQLNRSNHAFSFPSGATIADRNGNRIVMEPEAIIDMRSLVVTMPNGGIKNSKSGEPIGNFPNGSTYNFSGFSFPLMVSVTRDMTMPPNFFIPTQSSALVREPSPAAE